MNCSNCGKELPPGASFCSACGAQNGMGGVPRQINTYMVPAVLSAIFCCLPFGVVSIVFAAMANSALTAGNYTLAEVNAQKARTWFWVAFALGLIGSVIWGIVQIFALVAAAAAS